jgi:ABC-type transport system involved in multi-copper enzyme maturation permease subunit
MVEQERERTEQELRLARALQHPVGVGVLAAGMLASFPGAVALLLLAAGHLGNEWSGRTLKSVLTQEGRRWRVLTAKLTSLWLAGIGLLLAVWAGLALLTVWFRTYDLRGPRLTMAAAWDLALPQLARALLVLASFVVLGVLAAVVVRNTLGTFFLAFAFLVASMILAGFTAATRATIAWW